MGRAASQQTQAVLAALLSEQGKSLYGLEIAEAAALPSGTLYPILARLEARGWVTSEWEALDPGELGRPRRRYYSLTAEGFTTAREELERAAARLHRAGIGLSTRLKEAGA